MREFSEIGVLSPSGGRRLPSQLLVGLEGSGVGRLGSGGTAGWLSDPLRLSTSSFRASALPAGVLPQSIRGVALTQELQNLLRKGAVEPAHSLRVFTAVSSSSRRLRGRGAPSSICRP